MDKHGEVSNSPENRPEAQDLALSIRDKILLALHRIRVTLKGEDRDIIAFEKNVDASVDRGKQAGEFFKYLIPKSLKAPEKIYEGHPESIAEELFVGRMKKIAKITSGRDLFLTKRKYDEVKEELKKDIFQAFTDPTIEHSVDNGILQTRAFGFRQESGNFLAESVLNYKEESFNIPEATLTVYQGSPDNFLVLENLLPNGSKFRPADLLKSEEKSEIDLDGKSKTTQTLIPVDLKDYQGTHDSSGDFYEAVYRDGPEISPTVAYGDLTKKGNMLTLLHEIAHAWQNTYYDSKKGKKAFNNFYHDVRLDLSVLARNKELRDGGTIDQAAYEQYVAYVQQELEPYEVEFNPETFNEPKENLDAHEFKLASFVPGRNESYYIRSAKFQELITDFVREERDAWAHAIKVLRFLRQKGFDLEPQLKTLKDVEDHIHPKLGTYQESLETMLESYEKRVRFAGKPKS